MLRTPTTDDQGLVERLRAGDAGAVEDLMARYAAPVFRLACSVTRNSSDAEEVVQDVLLSVVRKIDAYAERAALGTWIYRITMNAALNKRRGKRSEVEVPLEQYLPAFTDDGHREGDRSFLLADWSLKPDEELLAGEARDTVRRVLDELPEDYRAVILLRDLEGLSNDEVAEVLGESVTCVKSRLHRARQALRERMTHFFMGEPAPVSNS